MDFLLELRGFAPLSKQTKYKPLRSLVALKGFENTVLMQQNQCFLSSVIFGLLQMKSHKLRPNYMTILINPLGEI